MNSRCKDTRKEQDCLWVGKRHPHLFLVEGFVLDTRFVSGDSFNSNETLPVVEKSRVGWRIGEEEPDDDRPYACCAAKLP